MDAVSAMLRGVSILELCLIIAMKHIVELHGEDPFNFEMVYNGTHASSVCSKGFCPHWSGVVGPTTTQPVFYHHYRALQVA